MPGEFSITLFQQSWKIRHLLFWNIEQVFEKVPRHFKRSCLVPALLELGNDVRKTSGILINAQYGYITAFFQHLPRGADPNLIKESDGDSFYDSITLDYDVPENDIRVDAKLELLKKYGAKSSWKNTETMAINTIALEEYKN